MPLILALRSSASFRPVVVSTGQHQAMVVEVFALARITPEVFVTGNTGIDALQWAAGLDVAFTDPRLAEIDESGDRVVLVTGHRRENWGGGLQRIGEGVALAARAHPDVHFVSPCTPTARARRAHAAGRGR